MKYSGFIDVNQTNWFHHSATTNRARSNDFCSIKKASSFQIFKITNTDENVKQQQINFWDGLRMYAGGQIS